MQECVSEGVLELVGVGSKGILPFIMKTELWRDPFFCFSSAFRKERDGSVLYAVVVVVRIAYIYI